MPFGETDIEDSSNSLSDVSAWDDDFARMQFESSSSEEEDLYSLVCHWRSCSMVRDNNQHAIRSANSLTTSSKKRKDRRASSEDAVLAAMRKAGNNNQEKRAM